MQPGYQTIGSGIAVHAERPKTGWLFHGRPKLLGNPGEASAPKRPASKAIGNCEDTLFGKHSECAAVKAVTRRNPYARIKPVVAQYRKPRLNPLALGLLRDAGELRLAMEWQQATALASADMTVAMQSDGCASRLERAHGGPEIRVGRRKLKLGVLVV